MTTRLFVSRMVHSKRAANKLFKRWKELGAAFLKTTKTHGSYMVRGQLAIVKFAGYVAEEAREQSKEPTND